MSDHAAIVEEIRSARAQMHVPVGLHLPLVGTLAAASGAHLWAMALGAVLGEAFWRRLAVGSACCSVLLP